MTTTIDPALLGDLGLTSRTTVSGPDNDLGQGAFLELLLAQLQNQDPLNPMENGEFMSQLAQFETASGIEELNSSFEALTSSLQSNQALQASAMVGRWVLTPSPDITLWPDVGASGAVNLPTASEQVLITVTDATGQVVDQIDLGAQSAGLAEFVWDGVDTNGNALEPGVYGMAAISVANGESEAVATLAVSPVESVTLNNGGAGVTLNVTGVGEVSLSDVEKIM